MSVDFDRPSELIAIELDGAQHFMEDPTHRYVQNGAHMRDVEKERQLLDKGFQVLRLLQQDVWDDTRNWDAWLRGEIARWRERRAAGFPAGPVRHPFAREYLGGIYARLRKNTP